MSKASHIATGTEVESDATEDTACAEIQAFVSRPEYSIRRTLSAHCRFEAHAHAAFTVTALLAGRMRASVGDDELVLTAGDVAFTGAGQLHAAEADEVDFVSIHIKPALINELAAEMNLTRTTVEIIFRAHRATDETLVAIAQLIAGEVTRAAPGHEIMLDALARQLAVHLLRSHLTVRKSAQIELSRVGPVDRRLRRALEFMHHNYERELALEEIAAAAYLSEYHFARLFKQVTGATPHVYLANLRIERARRLLVETAHPIIEIAAMVGYQSQSHFTKIFKSVTGVTPRAYRESSKR
ncbi:MAG TPA: AraC family transcriptional regulator [Blastocatellia bacterium]|nr:AraC family transcriptional regulator [Blastocatellia bacterium]